MTSTPRMLVIDGDYPMAYGAMELDRDLTQPIQKVRSTKPGTPGAPTDDPNAQTMASLPGMRAGHVAAALVKVATRIHRPGNPLWGYNTPEAAYAHAQGQLAYYRIMAARQGVRLLTKREEFAQHVQSWLQAPDVAKLPIGFVLGLEGADPILTPEQVHDWWNDGIRVVSLAHYGVSTYAHGTGTGTDGGLFPPAKPLLAHMQKLGMILDITHTSDASARQSLELFSGAVCATHQNCRALVQGERQFPDDILKQVIQRGGVIGVSFDTWMLYRGGNNWAQPKVHRRDVFARAEVTLRDVADQIDHICQLAGNADHAGIGADTDGQGGAEGAPAEIDTITDYLKVADVLAQRKYTDAQVRAVMYGNWQRFYERNLPPA